jgi:hypothetical protein
VRGWEAAGQLAIDSQGLAVQGSASRGAAACGRAGSKGQPGWTLCRSARQAQRWGHRQRTVSPSVARTAPLAWRPISPVSSVSCASRSAGGPIVMRAPGPEQGWGQLRQTLQRAPPAGRRRPSPETLRWARGTCPAIPRRRSARRRGAPCARCGWPGSARAIARPWTKGKPWGDWRRWRAVRALRGGCAGACCPAPPVAAPGAASCVLRASRRGAARAVADFGCRWKWMWIVSNKLCMAPAVGVQGRNRSSSNQYLAMAMTFR